MSIFSEKKLKFMGWQISGNFVSMQYLTILQDAIGKLQYFKSNDKYSRYKNFSLR